MIERRACMSFAPAAFAACTFLASGAPAFAQSATANAYPEKPITMIVPFAAGGTSDVIARVIGEQIGRHLGKAVVNENVAATPAFAATRSVPDIEKVGLSTLSPMAPEATCVGLLLASLVVPMDTLVSPAVMGPIVSPLMVTVTAAPPPIADVPVSVNTMACAVGVATVAVLLLLNAAVGLPEAAKKPDG